MRCDFGEEMSVLSRGVVRDGEEQVELLLQLLMRRKQKTRAGLSYRQSQLSPGQVLTNVALVIKKVVLEVLGQKSPQCSESRLQ